MGLLDSPMVRVRRHGAAHVVEVRGEVDLAGAPAVRDALAQAVDEGSGAVVVDLGRTPLLSSAVLSTLLNAVRRLARQRRRLVLVGGPGVERILRLARLEETFPVYPDLQRALAHADEAVSP